jgi:lantibiotic modifying enzyme
LLVARTCLDDEAGAGSPAAVRVLTSRPVLSDLSLCHGELGIAESLTMLTTTPERGPAPLEWRLRAGLILGTIYRYTPCCGTPGGVITPGLFNGLAGIGYGLLRLGYPHHVPSVLFLQPTPPSAQQQPV